ncbi:MAG: tetratricopeptide repeat protein [Promethearchaeota archaeon]
MIKIYSKALKKIMFHTLLFGGGNVHSGSFNMVYGVLGGKVINDQVYLEDVCLLEHGKFDTVQVANKGYGRIEKFMYEQFKKSSFITGWYCSISNKGNFYNPINYQNQYNYQCMNELAIAVVVHPENFLKKDFRNCFEIVRLKDDLSDAWVNLDFKIIDDKLENVLKEIIGSYQKLFEIFDLKDLDDEYLDNYLDKEDDYSKSELYFDQDNNIPTKYLSKIGISSIKEQYIPKTIEIYKSLLKKNPKEPVFYKNIAFCYDKLGNYNKSTIYYKKALFYDSHDAQDYFKIADIYAKRRLYRWAIKTLEKVKKKFGDFAELYNRMEFLYYEKELQDYNRKEVLYIKKGLQCFLKSFEFDPENHFSAFNIGIIYLELRKKNESIEFCVDFLEENYFRYLNREEMERAVGRFLLSPEIKYEEIEKFLDKLINFYVSKHNFPIAISLRKKKADLKDLRGKEWLKLGHLYKNIKDYENALKAYKEAIDRNPSDMLSLLQIGKIYLKLGKKEEAEETFKRIMGHNFPAKKYLDAEEKKFFIKEFIINEYITLRLEDGKSNIYVNEKLFTQCKYLLLSIPIEELHTYDSIESIDEAAELLDRSLEGKTENIILPEVEYWGHCSNLQVWAEMGYDTRILHRNLAFPLLKRLNKEGDVRARGVLKEEIVKRFIEGNKVVRIYLLKEGYLKHLNNDEKKFLIEELTELKDLKGIELMNQHRFSY